MSGCFTIPWSLVLGGLFGIDFLVDGSCGLIDGGEPGAGIASAANTGEPHNTVNGTMNNHRRITSRYRTTSIPAYSEIPLVI